MDTRTIDPCPRCGASVSRVDQIGSTTTQAQPCGHPVTVTMWPDRVQLEQA